MTITPQHERIREEAAAYARDVLRAAAPEIDRKGEFPEGHLEGLAAKGWFGLYVPQAYGGKGSDFLSYALVVEEVAAQCASTSVILTTQILAIMPLLLAGSPEQKERFLPRLASGEALGAIGITEPEAGSDVSNIQTRAEKRDGHYVLNGRKVLITNAGLADIYIILARTGEHRVKGLSMFVVEKNQPGLSFGERDEYMGMRGAVTREVILKDVIVPEENLLGAEGSGFFTLMNVFNFSRTLVGAQGVGIAKGALEYAGRYLQTRVQFGKPLAQNEMLQGIVADLVMQTEAARELVHQAAIRVECDPDQAAYYASIAKCVGSDTAMNVTTQAVQLLGGYGYSTRHPLERMMRDAKVTQIYDGTNQIQRLIVAREWFKTFDHT